MTMDMAPEPERHYQSRCESLAHELDAIERTIARIAYSRLAVFLLAVAALACGAFWTPALRIALYPLAALLLATFVILVIRHSRVEERRDLARQRLAFNRESIAAIHRDWANLPQVPAPVSEDHPYAVDLDLAGAASLFQLLDRGATPLGRATLQQWLLAPAAPDVIARRQEAVRALAADVDLREELAAWARLLENDPEHLSRFLAWAEGDPWLLARPLLLWTTRVLTVVSLSAIMLAATGAIGAGICFVTGALAGALSWIARRPMKETFDRAANSGRAFERYIRLIDRVSRVNVSAPLVQEISRLFHADGVAASATIRRFTSAADRSNLRYSAAIFHLIIQVTTLWDFHVLAALESWQRSHGRRVRAWLHALADLEALVAFAGLLHDNPSFSFPEIAAPDTPIFNARGLGHPLMAETVRVANDVKVGPPGTFLLVTGSNMSGKSTLLRAIGLSAVLAQAGAPVCATSLRLSPSRVCTSMRVHDSLAHGVSYFMAALTRLKMIVDASRDGSSPLRAADAMPLFYLLDEILQGTNTAERQVAVRRIVGFLLKQHAIGVVTSHDLDLAAVEPLASAARMVHFSERFTSEHGRETMSFDYTLMPGVATSRNALKLMEMVGLVDRDLR